MIKTAKLDFIDKLTVDNSRQIEDSFAGIDGVINPPEYLDFERLLELYRSSEIYYRAVNIKAQYTVGLGWRLVDNESTPNPADRERVSEFLSSCNPELSFSELLSSVMIDLECLGNSYLEVTRDSLGRISRLFHIPAQTVRVKRDGGFLQIRNGKKREFARFGAETIEIDETTNLPMSEIIHLAKYNPASSFYGMPDSVPAIGALMGDLMARDYNVNFFDNNATPQYCLMISGGTLSTKDKEELTKYLSDLKGNPHKTMVLQFPQGITGELKPISASPKDASFADYRMMNRDLMVVAHGVPPHLLGIIESGNLGGGTGETQLTNFKNLIISPRQRFLSERITRLIINQGLGVKSVRFVFNELDVEDELRLAQIDKILIDAGVISADEVRKRMGLE